VGEGLNTAFQAMAKLRLKPPEICERENSVIVSIKHEPLASPETTIMDYLNDHQEITNKKARQITGITSEGTIKGVFYRLHRTGLIELIPGRPKCKASWCKTGTFKNQDENTKPMEDLYPEYEKKILEYLADNEEINNRQAREIIGIDASKAKNVFNRLRKKSLLEIVPGKPRNKSTWRRLK
jgi:predicted HTH transcriptional regulator